MTTDASLAEPVVAAADPAAATAPAAQFLTFALDADVFALDIRMVREIVQYGTITTVPLLPAFVSGVINLRGAVVPVIDLNVRFGRRTAPVGEKTCIIIIESQRSKERTELGLLVDAVSEVIEIDESNIEPAPNFGAVVRRDFIRGMGKVNSRFVVLLEPDKAFDVDEMADLCESAQWTLPH